MSVPRPVTVWYSGGSKGHCKTVRTALVCASRWVLQDKQIRAVITHEGTEVAEVYRSGKECVLRWSRVNYLEL